MPGPMGRRPSSEKVEKGTFKKSIGKLLKYCKKYWGWMIFAISLGIVSVVTQIIGPNKIQSLIDVISNGLFYNAGNIDLAEVTKICVLLVCLYVVGALFNYGQQIITTIVTQKISKKLRQDISAKINRMPLKYFDTHLHGDVLSRVTNDVDTVGQSLNESVGSLFSNLLLFTGVVIMMFVTEPIMAVTVIVASFLGFAFSLIFITRSQKYFNKVQENLGELNAHIEESYSGHNVVRLFNAEQQQKKEFDEINTRLYKNVWKSQFMSGVMGPVMGFIGNFGYVAVCIVGAILASKRGVAYFGVISAFMIYVRMFSRPLSSIAQSLTSLQSASAASKRVFDFLESEELDDESAKNTLIENVQGNVTFDHVTFGYNPEKIIIKDFSLDVKKGQKVAIVGPTGAGKTTLVNLLMRFYEVNSGDILVDGVSTKDIKREDVHSMFGMVLQDTWLFEGTIRENLKYNYVDVSDEQMEKVCKSVGIDHFIQTLPKGYDTVIDDAINMSAGQKQLLTIARTMLANCPMVILDEATSSVDTRTEVLLQQAMDKAMEGRTSFIIAHRLSTIKNADIILVLQNGDIVEKGNHETLLAKGGAYAELYNSQFEEE
ncbi:MAG: ABC transporter ATP-binding protein [Clostridia bacterium]|nr:ABC transporter ATP-binding protein [Clostridia bacterium]